MISKTIGLSTAGVMAVAGVVFGALTAIHQWPWPTYIWAGLALIVALIIAAINGDPKHPAEGVERTVFSTKGTTHP